MANTYTFKPKLTAADAGLRSADRGEEQFVHHQTQQRIEPPRESIKQIKKNQVKRTTALFESGDAAQLSVSEPKPLHAYVPTKYDSDSVKPDYPYRPSNVHMPPASVDTDVKAKPSNVKGNRADNKMLPDRPKLPSSPVIRDKPNYPYTPAGRRETVVTEEKPQYPYRPKQLVVHKNENPDEIVEKPGLKPPVKPPPLVDSKVNDQKPQLGDKRVSALVANKTKLFECTDSSREKPFLPSKPTVKLKTPFKQAEDDDVTPTNENSFPSENTTVQIVPDHKSEAEKPSVKTALGTKVLPGKGPPPKPPRTFAHDDYVKVKNEKRKALSADYFDQNNSSHPFYEEVKPNGTIRRNNAKKAERVEKVKTYDSVNDEFKDKMRIYEQDSAEDPTQSDKVRTYEKIADIEQMAKKAGLKPPPPPRPNNSALSEARKQATLEVASQQKAKASSRKWSGEEPYHDQPMVQVYEANAEMPRKVKPAVVQRGIANPSYQYSLKHECIPIKVVPMRDGSLKRYKSDEFLYAEPDTVVTRDTYRDPVDVYRRGARPTHVTAAGVEIDHEGYAMPVNAVNRLQMKEQLSEAYSVLRRKKVKRSPTSEAPTSSTDDDDSDTEVDLSEHRKKMKYVTTARDRRLSTRQPSIYASAMLPQQRGANQLYSYAMIVSLEDREDNKIYTPTVLYTFPHQGIPLTVIASFCFPDATNWRPVSHYQSESYSFVLTAASGDRQYGYCRRFLPPGTKDRLPEVYCIISNLQSWNFYNLLLEQLEKKRTISLDHAQELLQAAYGRPMPNPGDEAWIKTSSLKGGTVRKQDCLCLRRPSDKRFEKVSLCELLECLSYENLIRVFSSMLLERRIILIAQHLGTLTKCIHALISLLYPFSWPHTFVPILPTGMLEVVESPTPFIVGVLTSNQQLVVTMELAEVLIIDIDNDNIIQSEGDELGIIPKKLQKALLAALKCKDGVGDQQRNKLISEAFLRMFIETIGHFTEFINTQQNGEEVFQKDMFVKAVNSKSIRMFLEWFSETLLFEVYIHEKVNSPAGSDALFEQRLIEYREEMERFSPSFKHNMKEAGKKLKNFFLESGEKLKKALRPNANVYV